MNKVDYPCDNHVCPIYTHQPRLAGKFSLVPVDLDFRQQNRFGICTKQNLY